MDKSANYEEALRRLLAARGPLPAAARQEVYDKARRALDRSIAGAGDKLPPGRAVLLRDGLAEAIERVEREEAVMALAAEPDEPAGTSEALEAARMLPPEPPTVPVPTAAAAGNMDRRKPAGSRALLVWLPGALLVLVAAAIAFVFFAASLPGFGGDALLLEGRIPFQPAASYEIAFDEASGASTIRRTTAPGGLPIIGITLGPSHEKAFGGKQLRVTIVARSTSEGTTSFVSNYYTLAKGNSGDRTLPLERDFRSVSFEYRVPAPDGPPGNDLLGIALQPGTSMDLQSVAFEIVAD